MKRYKSGRKVLKKTQWAKGVTSVQTAAPCKCTEQTHLQLSHRLNKSLKNMQLSLPPKYSCIQNSPLSTEDINRK